MTQEVKKIKSLTELDQNPRLFINGRGDDVKTFWPIYLEDKLVHLVLKKPKRIVVGVFQTEALADETINKFEKEYGKREFYKRKLKMDKSVYQDPP